jgi:ABC-type antimicrobial peptide transport system permease subunit
MFFTYLRRELRRRMRQAIFISLGLALGIGLVITVTAASAGVKNAQGKVLHALYGVGTDVTVTQSPSEGSGGPFRFRVGGPGGSAERPKAGTTFTRDTLIAPTLGTLKSASLPQISRLAHVTAVTGVLNVTDLRVSGKIPAQPSGGLGGFPGGGSGDNSGSRRSSFQSTSFNVEGVDPAAATLGPLSSGKLASGRTFSAADATSDVALVTADYARQHKLKAGSSVTVAGKKFTIVGTVNVPTTDSSADLYIPLARAQSLAGMKNEVNTVYVAAGSSTSIPAVSKEVSALLPKATVTTSSDLASEVTGSLGSAASLANNLGKWLAVAVLIVAFGLASLLTVAAVSRRVAEFGTLKALGWRGRRIVGQVMGEALAIGVIGGVAGVALGYAGAGLVSRLAPALTASTGLPPGSATPGGLGGRGFAGRGPIADALGAAHTVSVQLSAPVTIGAVVLAVILAVAGGFIAGGFGGWRAARLRPAAALARVA